MNKAKSEQKQKRLNIIIGIALVLLTLYSIALTYVLVGYHEALEASSWINIQNDIDFWQRTEKRLEALEAKQ